MIHREISVVELSSIPRSRGVAGLASCREPRRYVVGVVRVLIIRLVTRIAIGRNVGVVVVYVATRTRHGFMGAGQRKGGVVVVEGRRNPRCRVVTHIASLREAGLHMVRILGVVEILQMAGDTSPAIELVVAVDVTLRTLQRGMCSGQSEAGAIVVKFCARPRRGGMA